MTRMVADGLGNRKFGEHSRDERGAESDLNPTVGASLLAKAVGLPVKMLNVPDLSRASPLPHLLGSAARFHA
jgi:hypothetical protein